MTVTCDAAHARRTNVQPQQLAAGDQIQDHGRTRTIHHVQLTPDGPFLAAIIHFDDDGDTLGIPPGINVTAWRAA